MALIVQVKYHISYNNVTIIVITHNYSDRFVFTVEKSHYKTRDNKKNENGLLLRTKSIGPHDDLNVLRTILITINYLSAEIQVEMMIDESIIIAQYDKDPCISNKYLYKCNNSVSYKL